MVYIHRQYTFIRHFIHVYTGRDTCLLPVLDEKGICDYLKTCNTFQLILYFLSAFVFCIIDPYRTNVYLKDVSDSYDLHPPLSDLLVCAWVTWVEPRVFHKTTWHNLCCYFSFILVHFKVINVQINNSMFFVVFLYLIFYLWPRFMQK